MSHYEDFQWSLSIFQFHLLIHQLITCFRMQQFLDLRWPFNVQNFFKTPSPMIVITSKLQPTSGCLALTRPWPLSHDSGSLLCPALARAIPRGALKVYCSRNFVWHWPHQSESSWHFFCNEKSLVSQPTIEVVDPHKLTSFSCVECR